MRSELAHKHSDLSYACVAEGPRGRRKLVPGGDDQSEQASRGASRARCRGRARAASRRDCAPHAESDLGDRRRLAPVGGGLPGDWLPACATTHLAYDADDDVWQGTFTPARRQLRVQGGTQRRLGRELRAARRRTARTSRSTSPTAASVKFYYDHKSHWVTDNQGSVIAAAPGSFQSELGCSGDWDPAASAPGCRTSTATASTRSRRPRCRPARTRPRSRSTRAWDENYGAGGVPNGAEHRVHRSLRRREGHLHLRRDDARPDDRGRRRSRRAGRPGALSHFDLARKDCLGTARNTTSKVWYTVADGVLSDVYYPTVDNTNVETLQYIVTDGATFTDLQARDMTYTVEAVPDTGGMACKVTAHGQERPLPDRDRLRHRPGPEHAC